MNLRDLQGTFKFPEDFTHPDRFQQESVTPYNEPIAVTKEQKREQYERFLLSLPQVLVSVQEVKSDEAVLDTIFEKQKTKKLETRDAKIREKLYKNEEVAKKFKLELGKAIREDQKNTAREHFVNKKLLNFGFGSRHSVDQGQILTILSERRDDAIKKCLAGRTTLINSPGRFRSLDMK